MRLVRVASLSALADCAPIAVDVGADEVMVVRVADRVYAIGNICTHDEVWLDGGIVHPESCEIECPMHEGRFDLRSGTATHEPCTEPVPCYPVRVKGDEVFIECADGTA